jgi:hypothetical protein
MTTAFVLSGGGSLGAVPVDVLQALAARDAVAGHERAGTERRVSPSATIDAVRDRSPLTNASGEMP